MDSKFGKRSKISKDRFSELPDDVLAFSLSFLPVKEASRTSILSSRWRNLWKDSLKFSSKLVLDVIGMRGSPYTIEILENRKLMAAERKKFVKWAHQIVQLDYGALKTFRLRFELRKKFSYHIDKWISMAIAKGVENFEIDFSKFTSWGDQPPNNSFYTFPDGLCTREAGAFLKGLHLRSCSLSPLDFKVFSSLVDLKLENVLVDQCIIAKFLTDCPNLEKLWLLRCYEQRCLTISGSYLKLQEFTIISCEDFCDVKINARNLKKLEVWGQEVNLSCVNVLRLSNLALVCNTKDGTSALSYALGKLSSDLPHLETLLMDTLLEENRIPSRLPLYTNLKKLIIKVQMPSQSLWGVIPLLHASPLLHWLELHLFPSRHNEKEFVAGKRPCDHPHHHLQQILVTGFDGSSHEMEFMQYLFANCLALQIITLKNIANLYDPERGFFDVDYHDGYVDDDVLEYVADGRKLMLDRVEEQLMPILPPAVHLVTM